MLVGFFEYKVENDNEKIIIERHFKIEYISYNNIFYSIKNLRYIKLLKLNNYEVFKIIDKILKNSKTVSVPEFIEYKLSDEISKEINKEILKKIMESRDGISTI